LRRHIGASVIRPSRLGWPTQQQRRTRKAIAVVRPQPITRDRHRQIEGKFCTIVGGVISPVLSNLFMHYAFDVWMTRTHPDLPWCRYADDGVVHCRTERDALALRAALAARLEACGL